MSNEKPNTSVMVMGCFGLLVFFVAYSALLIILRGILIYYYFDWFIAPATEWQLLGLIHAIGFAGAWSYMINGMKIEVESELSKKLEGKIEMEKAGIIANNIMTTIASYAFALLIGYILSLYI